MTRKREQELLYPEIAAGTVVFYMGRNGEMRTEKVKKRIGNVLTIVNCQKEKRRIDLSMPTIVDALERRKKFRGRILAYYRGKYKDKNRVWISREIKQLYTPRQLLSE